MTEDRQYAARAELSVMNAYRSSGYPLLDICEPEKWAPCAAREVAFHAINSLIDGKVMHESWIEFPGGWPRFCDMVVAVSNAAKIEQGDSIIDQFSLTLANEILKQKGNEKQ